MSDAESSSDNNGSKLEPYLPPELEHIVFTAAFDHLDPATNIAMLLVAKRVQEWITPLIYRVVDQVGVPAIPDFENDTCPPAEKIGHFVRHLILGRIQQTEAGVESILVHCPNIATLACWYSLRVQPLIPILARMGMYNLRMLSGNLAGITKDELCSPTFLRLTHIELISPTEDILRILPSYIPLSQLTHLRLYNIQSWDVSLIHEILTSGQNLQALILTELYNANDPESERARVSPISLRAMHKSDMRLVILDSSICDASDWIRGIRGGYDSWIFTDQILTARKEKYFKEGEFQNRPFTSDFRWFDHLVDKGKGWYWREYEELRRFDSSPSIP